MAFLLIVDDDPVFADAVAAALGSDGHETLVENDLDDVRRRIEQRMPDLLILDVMFPENPCGGFELARTLGRQYQQLPVLMLTAVNEQFPLGFSDKDIDSTWLPVSAFLEKPIDFRVLRERVKELLAQRGAAS